MLRFNETKDLRLYWNLMPDGIDIWSILVIGTGFSRGAPPPPLRGRVGVGGQPPRRPPCEDDGMASPAARRLRANPAEAERTLWRHLRGRQVGGHKFRRQQPVGYDIVDFVCLRERLVVEVDGGQHGPARDSDRDAWLARRRYRVLRFWNNDVLANPDGVVQEIATALDKNIPPTPTLPRKGGGSSDSGLRHPTRTLPVGWPSTERVQVDPDLDWPLPDA